MLKIRLMRIGAKKKPFYRVVAVDERKKRTGSYIESLGTYNPLTQPKEINLKQDRIDYWLKQGAQASVGFLRIIGKAPQRKPRKPKKQAATPQVTDEKPSTEETPPEAPAIIPQEPAEEPVTEQEPIQEEKEPEQTPAEKT